jgi:DNA-binding GntR family transcriptional regulator
MSVKVYDRIREDIASGELAPGTPLVEVAMAERYRVSRTPIREALRMLEQDGLVERADRGMRVRTRSAEEILEIYDVRIALEAAAARWAASRRTEYDLVRLHGAHERMLAVEAGDGSAMAESNRRFHETVWAASHNGTLIDMLGHLSGHISRYPATTLTRGDRWAVVIDEHQRLIAAIEARDEASAAEIAETHMAGAREIRLQMAAEEDGS